MLRVMTERLGDIGYPFSRHLSRQAQNYASELRDVRNRWAHNEKFTAAEAYRAIDTAELAPSRHRRGGRGGASRSTEDRGITENGREAAPPNRHLTDGTR